MKANLKNGMIVKSTGGRYGVVCLKDETDENCIKFLYDPKLLKDHGYLYGENYGSAIISLDDFDDDLRITNEEGQEYWSIEYIYEMNLIHEKIPHSWEY